MSVLRMLLLVVAVAWGQFWQNGPLTDFRLTRFDGEYSAQTGKVYFLGGRLADDETDDAVRCFVPDSASFRATGARMPVPVSNYTICLLRDGYSPVDTYGLYIVGGRKDRGRKSEAVQVFYPITNSVRAVSTDPFPMRINGQSPYPGGCAAYGNKLYVFGGFNESIAPYLTGETWVYDPLAAAGTRWQRVLSANLSVPRCYITTAVANGKIYALGGATFTPNVLRAQKIAEVFDPVRPELGWQRIADMPDSSAETRAFGFDSTGPLGLANRIVVAGNGKWPGETNQCFVYNVTTNTWSLFASLNQARKNHAGVYVPTGRGTGGRPGIWVFGGRHRSDTTLLNSSEFYQLPGAIEEPASRQGKTGLRLAGPSICAGPLEFGYWLAQAGMVRVSVHAADGRSVAELASGWQDAGRHRVRWHSATAKPGLYFARIVTAGATATRKFTKMR